MITRYRNLIPKILPGLPGDCIDINYIIAFLTRSIVGIPLLHPLDFDRDMNKTKSGHVIYVNTLLPPCSLILCFCRIGVSDPIDIARNII